jgi:carbonic anhydrase
VIDSPHPFPNADDLVARNARYADTLDGTHFDVRPSRQLAVIACMDSRMDIFSILGLENGEAHIIRNAGGAVTDDTIRSVCLSQRFLGTREIILLHHTDCGLYNLDENEFRAELQDELGVRPTWTLEAFTDPYADTLQSIRRLELSPFVKHTEVIQGYVYNVDTGRLDQVRSTRDG